MNVFKIRPFLFLMKHLKFSCRIILLANIIEKIKLRKLLEKSPSNPIISTVFFLHFLLLAWFLSLFLFIFPIFVLFLFLFLLYSYFCFLFFFHFILIVILFLFLFSFLFLFLLSFLFLFFIFHFIFFIFFYQVSGACEFYHFHRQQCPSTKSKLLSSIIILYMIWCV